MIGLDETPGLIKFDNIDINIVLPQAMHVIPLEETIYFNATMVDYPFLSAITLFSFAYHPLSSNILYLLYGSTSSLLFLLIRDSSTGAFLQNATIMQSYVCTIGCQIKATENLLLIESESLIGVYPIRSGFQIQTTPIISSPKIGLTQVSRIHRWADINGPRFFIIIDADSCLFGSYSSAGSGFTSSFGIQLAFDASDILFAGLSSSMAYLAVNSSSVALIYYNCLSCAFGGSLLILGARNSLVVPTGVPAAGGYRMYEGTSVSNPSNINGIIYWTFSGGQSWRWLINPSGFGLIEYYNNYTAVLAAANREYYLLVGSDQSINFRSFEQLPQEDQYETYSFSGYGIFTASTLIVQLSSDSSIVGARTLSQSWTMQQFQLVQNCYDYNATQNILNSFFCDCLSYEADGRCVSTSFGSGPSSSFGLAGIVSLVAGVVVVAVSVIIIKKNYRSCVKGMKRTPYVYHPTELMSFEA